MKSSRRFKNFSNDELQELMTGLCCSIVEGQCKDSQINENLEGEIQAEVDIRITAQDILTKDLP